MMPRKLRNLKLDRVDLVTAGANPGAFVMLHKFDAPDNLEGQMADKPVEAPEAPVKKDDKVSQEAETVAKADFEALQKQLQEMADLRKAETDKSAELAERIAKMERERKTAEFVAKARELANMGAASELGLMLLEASEGMSPESYQLLERTLKAANAQVEKGALFATIGRADGEVESWDARLSALAKAKVDAGTAKTRELAIMQVLNENPGLKAEYMSAQRAR